MKVRNNPCITYKNIPLTRDGLDGIFIKITKRPLSSVHEKLAR